MKPTDAMAYAANGEILGPLGVGDPDAAPHGVYATLGRRRWIAIAVFDEEEWSRLKEVMGDPSWAEEERFSSLEARKANEDELNERVEQWTRLQEGHGLMRRLTGRGVRAGVVHDAGGAIKDPHLVERGFWLNLDHPEMGTTLYNRTSLRMSRTPVVVQTAAPLLGQHTREVLTGMLGYSEHEVGQMTREGILV
jgi:benzylsuccinate CoA-transferase BbsF subunit/naphthyl-2-methylsuccinate CoA transferase subunit